MDKKCTRCNSPVSGKVPYLCDDCIRLIADPSQWDYRYGSNTDVSYKYLGCPDGQNHEYLFNITEHGCKILTSDVVERLIRDRFEDDEKVESADISMYKSNVRGGWDVFVRVRRNFDK